MTTKTQSLYTSSTAPHVSHASMDRIFQKYSSSTITSTPTTLYIKRTSSNPLQGLIDSFRLGYYRYEVTYGLYVMTPGEKCVVNLIVVVVFMLLSWALALYFPAILYHKFTRLTWLVTGHSDEQGTIGILDKHVNHSSPLVAY
ncbi:hypothetical protein N7520_007829 [Penicillium odoratum]|uniref:uncharacterized protein n=1 Tax=Penicillium odoratum TaxID=1167516 RepID=UPI002547FBB0|nr:uncharacterized protein N7520_007829 [Penicillium odoratum]KAJ5760673.1 hypothetical protein N7520_007829 [Penicillium odoratum]